MSAFARRILPSAAVALLLCQCASPVIENENELMKEPALDKMEHAKLDDPGDMDGGKKLELEDEPPVPGLAPVSGKEGRFIIRDPKGSMRVDGVLKDGRMDGKWQYFDPTGRRLAEVNYRADQRHGPVTLFYVSGDGKAAGRKRMAATYEDGTLHGFAKNWYAGGGKYLEREFDRGILQGVRGWLENGQVMSDGAAQSSGIAISGTEDALLSELEAFVQLKIRQNAPGKPPVP